MPGGRRALSLTHLSRSSETIKVGSDHTEMKALRLRSELPMCMLHINECEAYVERGLPICRVHVYAAGLWEIW
jgi:hypothetical protein